MSQLAQPALNTSGQLDWVVLSRSAITYSLEAAARLANAGVEIITVGVSNALFSPFRLPPSGQSELSNSLTYLKGCSSFSNALWFGFGVKHIVRNLSETEEGATCVAMCAALAVPYTPFRTAQILRELCCLRGTPLNLSPSLSQWSKLVEACAGALAKSHFPNIFDGFSRLLVPSRHPARVPARPEAIAKALIVLSNLSNRSVASATFFGGLDAALLAAISQCLLCLSLEIRDERGNILHKSNLPESETMVQAIFIRESYSSHHSATSNLVKHTYFITSGDELLQERLDLENAPYRGPTRWSSILSDTFPEWNAFSNPFVTRPFSSLLEQVALQAQHKYSATSSGTPKTDVMSMLHWEGFGNLYHPRHTGLEFLRFARKLLPELICSINESTISLTVIKNPEKHVSHCLDQIGQACRCRRCYTAVSQPISYTSHCLKNIALTVVRFLWILAPVIVHDDIPPTISGLKHIYNSTDGFSVNANTMPQYGIELVLFIFTGRLKMHHNHSRISAAASRGVCVFFSILKDINVTPTEATAIEVIPGHIKNHEHMYYFITDIGTPFENFDLDGRLPVIIPDQVQLIADEMEDHKFLEASYKITSSANISLYLGIVSVVETVSQFLRNETHPFEDCAAPVVPRIFEYDWSLQFPSSVELHSENEDGMSLDRSHLTSWSVLAWESWDTVIREEKRQRLEIDVVQMDFVTLYLSAVSLDCRYLRFPYDHKRNHLVIAPLCDCSTCIIRLVSLLWWNLPDLKGLGSVPMKNWPKGGLLRKFVSSPEKVVKAIDFEMFPLIKPISKGFKKRFSLIFSRT
jgi:hypothetical protein